MRFFCFGLGYTGAALARRLQKRGWNVAGTSRTVEKQQALCREGIRTYIFTSERDLPRQILRNYDYILNSIPPAEGGRDRVLESYSSELSSARWVGYLSTTGVYGDRDGGWVDEETPPRPTGERQRRRVLAENLWLNLARSLGLKTHIFRLAGIYGPERNALVALRAGTARRIDKPGHINSRIHVDDIVAVLSASMAQPQEGGSIYNVCDDAPSPPHEVVTYASHLLGLEPPPLIPFDQAELSPMARSFYLDSRRVSNQKIKRQFELRLKFPSYRDGLDDLLRHYS